MSGLALAEACALGVYVSTDSITVTAGNSMGQQDTENKLNT